MAWNVADCPSIRMARGSLQLEETLCHATRIAAGLRDLHAHGLVHGAVSSHSIVLGPQGAELRNSGGLTRRGDCRCDVTAFGEVLEEILRRTSGPEYFLEEIRALAARCREGHADMLRVLIGLRILALEVRQSTGGVRRPQAPRRRWQAALARWKPLANLAALAVWSK